DLRVVDQGQGVVGHLNVTADVARGVGVPGGNVGHLNRPSCPAGKLLGVALQNIEGATAYGAQTTYTHFDRFQTRNPTILTSLNIGFCPPFSRFYSLAVASAVSCWAGL